MRTIREGQQAKTIYSAIFKFSLKGHTVVSNEDSNAIKLALGKLSFIPAERQDVSLEGVAGCPD